MKQYTQPALEVYEIIDDLLTVTYSEEQVSDDITFDWGSGGTTIYT